ncbi:MAG TPA: RNA polymerase sigma factor [Verrucomicrobiota bacterium]|nr:RNA polymerase sigma factor [Verrucomicrobiota bacterium]HNU49452.1 RNA polymerase sigma factor [Verrucomicrobiota bacterium]
MSELSNPAADAPSRHRPREGEPLDAPRSAEPSNEELARRSQLGDPDAFGHLIGRCADRLYHFLRPWVDTPQDAEDLTQITLIKAYRSLPRYRTNRPFAPWLFTIARRTAISHRRSLHPAASPLPEDPAEPDPNPSPSAVASAADDARSLWTLARRLKPKQYEALWLRYAEGFEIPEIARILETNVIHVKVLLHRARRRLASLLAPIPPTAARPQPSLQQPQRITP